MKLLIVLILGLLAVGCGQSDIERLEEEKLTQEYETEFQMSEDENKRLEAEIESNKLKALKAETDKTKKEPPTNPTDQNTAKAKPVKDQGRKLTLEEKKVVGEYVFEDEDRITWKYVLLENGILEFYENGEKKSEGTYNDNGLDGLYTIWDQNGNKYSEETYKDGERFGELIYYKEDGSVKE